MQHLDKESVVVTAASVGLLGTVFSRQPLFAPGLYFVVYGFLSIWAKVRSIPSTSQADHAAILWESVGLVVLSMLAGVIVGATFVWALRTPLLIDTTMFYESRQPYRPADSWRAIFYPWHLLWFFSIYLGLLGIYAVIDRLDAIPPDIEGLDPHTSLGVGIALLVVAVILLLLSSICACRNPMPSGKPGGYTIGYTFALGLLATIPTVFYWTREDLSYYSVLLVLGIGIVAYSIVASITLCFGSCSGKLFTTESISSWRRYEFWLALFFVHMALITLTLVVGEFYMSGRQTTIAIYVVSVVLVAILIIYGLCFGRRTNEPEFLTNAVVDASDYDRVSKGFAEIPTEVITKTERSPGLGEISLFQRRRRR